MKHLVAPSILSADFGHLADDVIMINESEADWIHVDVMDGRFVPNISFGLPVVASIKEASQKPLDVHLMIVEPEKYLSQFHKAGADILTIHIEAVDHLHKAIQTIKGFGIKAGVALNPHTPISSLEDIIKDIDLVIVMSVNPGFGGQKFIPQTLEKVKKLRQLILSSGSKALIEVDGGVGTDNAQQILKGGADVLVAGNSVFKSKNPKQTIAELKHINVNTIHV